MTVPPYWQEAIALLSKCDPILADLIAAYPNTSLATHLNPFHTLMRAIVGQQISTQAADAVWQRLTAQLPAISPDAYLAIDPETLRQCGLSRQKVAYITNIALAFQDGSLTPQLWVEMADEAIAKQLMAIKGIGQWTAEMFLIFHLQRSNILPLTDLGLINAIKLHYGKGVAIAKPQMLELAMPWQPYRTVATWYLWRSLDPAAVQY
jgi:DNA-3-methyladenine glycosylase II